MSLLDKAEISRAQVGPRASKDPRSKDYAIQTLYALKLYAESLRCDQELVAKELATIDRYRHWEVLGYPSKDALLAAELSVQGLVNVEKVKSILDAAPDLQPEGRPWQVITSENRKLSRGGNDRLAARLKRDHPDICARIKAGEFTSIRAAAIAAGIIKVKSPFDQLCHWWTKADDEARQAFKAFIA